MRKIAILLVLTLTISYSYQATNIEVEATGIELVAGELLYDLLLSIVITTAGQAFVDEMVEAGYVAGEIELTDIGEFIRSHKKLILVAGGVAIVDLFTGDTDTTVDLTPDNIDMTEGNMAQDLVTGQNTVDERKQDFMDWYFDSVEYVGTYPDGSYKVKEPTWSNVANKYYYVYRFYDTLEEAFSHFPYEYQQMMHEFGQDWVEWYSKVWVEYQVDNDLVSSSGAVGIVTDAVVNDFLNMTGQMITSEADVVNYINSLGIDLGGETDLVHDLYDFTQNTNYAYLYIENFGTWYKIRIIINPLPMLSGYSYVDTDSAGTIRMSAETPFGYFEWSRCVIDSRSSSYNSTTLYDLVQGSNIARTDWINNYDYTIYNGASGDIVSPQYFPLDLPISTDTGVSTVIGNPVDVGFEEDEDGNIGVVPGDIPGITFPDVGTAETPTQEDLTKQSTNVLQEVKEWIQSLTEAGGIAVPEDPGLKPTPGFSVPSIPNLFALLVMILIQILLLFIKGFVIVGLIFKIPVSTTLFHPDTLLAIEKTKQLTLGGFNLSIHELLSWIVTFVFTFILLKTLKRHLDTFRVT